MKRTFRQFGAPALAFTTALSLAQFAQAQDAPPAAQPAAPAPAAAPAPEPAPAPAPATAGGGAQVQAGGTAQAQGGGAMTLPGAAPAAQAAAGDSDHDAVVGSLGIGFLGARTVGVGCVAAGIGGPCAPLAGLPAGTPVAAGLQAIDAPVIGLRYWIDQTIGIDAGVGVAIGNGSLSVPAPVGDVPQPSFSAFLIHAGLPLSLASSSHYSFQLVPEVNVGFSSWSQDVPTTQGFSGSGFHFDVGARAGAEIHFGFMGLPKLALQGTIGLLFRTDSTTSKDKTTGDQVKASSTGFQTTLQNAPWDIFITNVAALYYF